MAKFFEDIGANIDEVLEGEFSNEGLDFNFTHQEMECSK